MRIYYREYDLDRIRERVARAEGRLRSLGVVRVVLFGSYASGRATAASDVDLLVLVRERKDKGNYHEICEALSMPEAEVHLYALDEFRRLEESGSWLAREATRRGVTLMEG